MTPERTALVIIMVLSSLAAVLMAVLILSCTPPTQAISEKPIVAHCRYKQYELEPFRCSCSGAAPEQIAELFSGVGEWTICREDSQEGDLDCRQKVGLCRIRTSTGTE